MDEYELRKAALDCAIRVYDDLDHESVIKAARTFADFLRGAEAGKPDARKRS